MTLVYDCVVIGAGAAGLMCAAEAGRRGRSVLLIDHAKKLAEKIRISGGGRCNFTNLHTRPQAYMSRNVHFCKSALKQFTQSDFVERVQGAGIAYHHKTLGQLFCDDTAQDIITMLSVACDDVGVRREMGVAVSDVQIGADGRFVVQCDMGTVLSESIGIATGGLSIPKLGATPFGYKLAEQFGVPVVPPRAGLVPLTFQDAMRDLCKGLSGVSVDAVVACGDVVFREGLLFTHRGLSGPSILQISSYWRPGQDIVVNFVPDVDVFDFALQQRRLHPKRDVHTCLAELIPARLAVVLCDVCDVRGRMGERSDAALRKIAACVNAWRIRPSGTEGYRTAEVTLGGVDTAALSSKTMEVRDVKGLYFMGEVVDVTGHLGGYNFQWAWSSGYVAGQNL